MVIYKTTNLVNQKFYVGKDAKNRKFYLGSGRLLKLAIKKYGKENFKKEILEHCISLEQLNEREIFWINKTNALTQGYNLAAGGTGGNTGGTGGAKKGSIPWNKGAKGLQVPWNKGLKGMGILKKNQTSFKSGTGHAQYGKKQLKERVEKRINTMRQNGTYANKCTKGPYAPRQVKNTEDGMIFESIRAAAKHYGLKYDHVGHSCRQETKTGKFRFLKD